MARILSVEDDPDFQHLISSALRNQGYEVHYAFTGPEGREKALSLNPDLILLDMMLPGMNGAELAKILKKNKATRDIPIVVLTAYPADANFFESEIKALGVVEYLRKPVQIEELVKTIRRLLSARAPKPPSSVWKRGAFQLLSESKSVWIEGKLVATLAPKRFEVLYHLLQSDGEVSSAELVRKIWGREGTKNDLEKTVSRLREDLGPEGYRLSTTRAGYQLAV
ncbi:MAG TPA: response regulator transcription factor [Elusimicrobiota bacterium]|nr:response regulator transcription factor [Elusimicrobiota bacterium]